MYGHHYHNQSLQGKDSRLITKHIGDVADAALVLGQTEITGQYKMTPMVLVPASSCCGCYVTIPEGFHALMTSWNRYIGIWSPGFHVAGPWIRVAALVAKHFVVFDSPVKECPTSDNVMVQIDVSMVVHVMDGEENIQAFFYRLGPERLEQMLKALQEEAVRSMVRQKSYQDIYDLMDTEEIDHQVRAKKLEEEGKSDPLSHIPQDILDSKSPDCDSEVEMQLQNTKRIMNQKLREYGVEVYSITITNVHLPQNFQQQMESATTFHSKTLRAAAEQKYNLIQINNDADKEKALQLMAQSIEKARVANDEARAAELKLASKYEADTNLILADIKEKNHAEVLDLMSNSALTVTKLEKEKQIELSNLDAQAQAGVQQIIVEMEGFVLKTSSEAELTVAKNDAETLRLKAEAERIAATKLRAKREFESRMAQLKVLKTLASNKNLSISGTNKDSVIAQLVAAKNSALALGINGSV